MQNNIFCTNNVSICKVANPQFWGRLLKCPQNCFVSTRWHDLRKVLPRSATKKFLRHFFQKVANPNLCNSLQAISYTQTLPLLRKQQITGFRAACPMARKPLCVATQHDLRKILLRSAIKSFLVLFLEKEQESSSL